MKDGIQTAVLAPGLLTLNAADPSVPAPAPGKWQDPANYIN